MDVALIVIGDELLSGDTLDTNSHFAAGLLNQNGINVVSIITVGDQAAEMKSALSWLHKKTDLVISMGGIGPTRDDKTKETFSSYFNSNLVLNSRILESLKDWYSKRNMPLNDLTAKQAIVPHNAEIIINPVGTAPILWFKDDSEMKELICLPGVPFEMKHLLEKIVIPRLLQRDNDTVILHKTIQTIGITESSLAKILAEVENEIELASDTGFFKLAYLPSPGIVKLRITGIGKDVENMNQKLSFWISKIQTLIGGYIFGYGDETISSAIGKLLTEKNATVGIAESCTGGYLSHLITSNPGSSTYYIGSVIPYHYHLKTQELYVDNDLLNEFGAVSEETVKAMVEGVLKKFNSTYAVATTGIAGPSGATPTKPLGTVWIAVGSKDKIIAKKFIFNYNRELNIQFFSITAMGLLRKFIRDEELS